MKKIGIILTFVFTLFVGTVGVKAGILNKESGSDKACSYRFIYSKYSDYKYSINYTTETIILYSGSTNNLKEVYRWNGIDFISNSKTCPTQLFYKDDSFSISSMPNFYSDNSFKNLVIGKKYCYVSYGKGVIYDYNAGDGYTKIDNINSKSGCEQYYNVNYEPLINGAKEREEERLSGSVVSCGNGMIKNIPYRIVKIVNTVISVIQIAVPILLIILGMIDLGKSVLGQKEDEIKKGQKVFISRLITGILVFFVIFIVKIAVRFVNESSDSSKIISCVDCFIQGNCE